MGRQNVVVVVKGRGGWRWRVRLCQKRAQIMSSVEM